MRKMGRERFLPGKAVLLIICLIVLAAKAFAIDHFKIKEYEELFLADAGCADLETLLTESENGRALSLENLTAENSPPCGWAFFITTFPCTAPGKYRGYAGKAVQS